MPSVEQKTRLLIVDTAPAMAEVLKTFASQFDYEADVFSDPAIACRELNRRSTSSAGAYDCVLLGWPVGKIRMIADLLGKLGAPEYADLPLIIISEQANGDVETLVKRRAKTRTLLWKDHRRASGHIESLVYQPEETRPANRARRSLAVEASDKRRILLVDNSPSVCHTLRDALESNGYQVAVAGTAKQARLAIDHQRFDLVVANFFLRDESSEEFCRHLQSLDSNSKPVYAMMTSKNLDSVVQRSLAAGAITCLDQTESTEMLLARLDAIVRGISQQATPPKPVQRDSKVPDTVLPVSGLPDSTLRDSWLRESGTQTMVSTEECLIPWSELVEMSAQPAVLIGADNLIMAGNDSAVQLLAGGNATRLININFVKDIYSARLVTNEEHKARGQFKTVSGQKLSVAYNARRIRAASATGVSSDCCLLTFEALGQPVHAELETAGVSYTGVSDTSSLPQSTALPAQDPASGTQRVPVKTASMLNGESIRSAIKAALDTDATDWNYHLLMLDIKITATSTGDRMSVGSSELMLEMVKKRMVELFPRDNSMAYLGDGRFALLLPMKKVQDGLKVSRNILRVIPRMMRYLSDIELVSHGSLVKLPRQSSMSPQHILNHSIAACKKTELDKRDNAAFVVNKGVYLTTETKSQVESQARVKTGVDKSAEADDVQQTESV